MSFEQIITCAISTFSLLFSLFTFIRHDNKIKKQNNLINSFQLEKFRKEIEADKKANIEVNVIRKEKGLRILKVYNKGKAIAKNVNVNFPKNSNVAILDYPSSFILKPQNSIEISMHVFNESPNSLEIDLEWVDDFNPYNKESQIIQL